MELEIKDCPDPIEDLLYQLERGGAWDLSTALRGRLLPEFCIAVSDGVLETLRLEIFNVEEEIESLIECPEDYNDIVQEFRIAIESLKEIGRNLEDLYNV